jgi:AcrR family transcriptional regulator
MTLSADTPAPRWRRRKQARPDEILAAALGEFAARGYAAARLDDIAAAAGVTKGTLYLYFPNKEELFKAVVRTNIVPRVAAIEAMIDASQAPAPALLARLIEQWNEVLAVPQLCAIPKLVLAESGNFPELARFYLEEVVQRGLGMIKRLLRRGVGEGDFRAVDIDSAAVCVVGPILLSMLWRHALEPAGAAPLDRAALGRTHTAFLLRALSTGDL